MHALCPFFDDAMAILWLDLSTKDERQAAAAVLLAADFNSSAML
jgi:hypothetical protein